MREGLHYLPRVQAQRDKADDLLTETFLDCATCSLSREERRAWRCGYVPAKDHLSMGSRPFPESETCPGYTIGLPEVLEAARALQWVNRGAIVSVYGPGQLPAFALDCIDLLDAAVKQVERETIQEQKDAMKR